MYRWVDHTAEVELALEAASAEEVFTEAMRALTELLTGELEPHGEPASEEVEVEAPDPPALLAAWLEELVFRSERDGFVGLRVSRLALSERALAATVEGRLADVGGLVKAVTYHRLALERKDGGWRGRVVFDV